MKCTGLVRVLASEFAFFLGVVVMWWGGGGIREIEGTVGSVFYLRTVTTFKF